MLFKPTLNSRTPAFKVPVSAIALALLLGSSVAFAQPKGDDSKGGERRGPPAEALEACKTLKAGDACSFTGQRGAMSGSCFTPQSDKPLACRPKDALPSPQKQ
jgi:hypothetical protein